MSLAGQRKRICETASEREREKDRDVCMEIATRKWCKSQTESVLASPAYAKCLTLNWPIWPKRHSVATGRSPIADIDSHRRSQSQRQRLIWDMRPRRQLFQLPNKLELELKLDLKLVMCGQVSDSVSNSLLRPCPCIVALALAWIICANSQWQALNCHSSLSLPHCPPPRSSWPAAQSVSSGSLSHNMLISAPWHVTATFCSAWVP